MSASPAAREREAAPAAGAGAPQDGLPEASLGESVRFVLSVLFPSSLRGLFAPRPKVMKFLTAANTDGRAVATVRRLRREHPGQGLRLFGGRLVAVWGPDALREVLDQSADVYASDAGAKGKGMSHFQPEALTLSRGEEWRDRRAFNEAVLAFSERVHPDARRFVAVVADEVQRLRIGPALEWSDWEGLFDHITLRVIFGDGARGDQELTGLLEGLMSEANRIVGTSEGGTDEFHEMHGRIERHLRDPEPGSLVAQLAEAPQTDRTRVVHQIPHWMFAMRDTLGANAYRALALIVADPEVERRTREEVEGADLLDPQAIDGMRYLEGCLQEAMRLWPTVPLIARETTRDTELLGVHLDEGTQVMISNVVNHRDAGQVPDADMFRPERWPDAEQDYRFNHLSHGTQVCPGIPLVLLLGKAVLAHVLDEHTLKLREPELDPSGPLPHMLDFFSIRFDAETRR